MEVLKNIKLSRKANYRRTQKGKCQLHKVFKYAKGHLLTSGDSYVCCKSVKTYTGTMNSRVSGAGRREGSVIEGRQRWTVSSGW